MAVSKRLRFEILRRDNHACRYCGATAPDVALTVDHVVPSALGGGDEPSNLVAACAPCNSGKSATPADAAIVDDVASDAVRWASAMERAARIRLDELNEQREHIEWFETIWTKYWIGNMDAPRRDRQYLPREPAWREKVLTFLAAGLDMPHLANAVQISMNNQAVMPENIWRYFCGICWRELDRRREIAAALIESDPH